MAGLISGGFGEGGVGFLDFPEFGDGGFRKAILKAIPSGGVEKFERAVVSVEE
jgi:hypothetical protein